MRLGLYTAIHVITRDNFVCVDVDTVYIIVQFMIGLTWPCCLSTNVAETINTLTKRLASVEQVCVLVPKNT